MQISFWNKQLAFGFPAYDLNSYVSILCQGPRVQWIGSPLNIGISIRISEFALIKPGISRRRRDFSQWRSPSVHAFQQPPLPPLCFAELLQEVQVGLVKKSVEKILCYKFWNIFKNVTPTLGYQWEKLMSKKCYSPFWLFQKFTNPEPSPTEDWALCKARQTYLLGLSFVLLYLARLNVLRAIATLS